MRAILLIAILVLASACVREPAAGLHGRWTVAYRGHPHVLRVSTDSLSGSLIETLAEDAFVSPMTACGYRAAARGDTLVLTAEPLGRFTLDGRPGRPGSVLRFLSRHDAYMGASAEDLGPLRRP